MSKTLMVLLVVTMLISIEQFASARVARHLDLRLIPPRSRRRVSWMLNNSGHFQALCAGIVVAMLALQVGATLS